MRNQDLDLRTPRKKRVESIEPFNSSQPGVETEEQSQSLLELDSRRTFVDQSPPLLEQEIPHIYSQESWDDLSRTSEGTGAETSNDVDTQSLISLLDQGRVLKRFQMISLIRITGFWIRTSDFS